jgi:hypothetical protein
MELVSLEILDAKARERGFLPYAAKAFYLREPADAWVPVLGRSEHQAVTRLVSKRLGLKSRPYQPPSAQTAAVEAASPAGEESPEASDSLTLTVLRRILKRVRGKRGVRALPSLPVWRDEDGAEFVLFDVPERLGINRRHPLAAAVAGSGLDEARQGLYLASLAFTAANRVMGEVTDLDDIRFHESLAELLAAPGARAPSEGG